MTALSEREGALAFGLPTHDAPRARACPWWALLRVNTCILQSQCLSIWMPICAEEPNPQRATVLPLSMRALRSARYPTTPAHSSGATCSSWSRGSGNAQSARTVMCDANPPSRLHPWNASRSQRFSLPCRQCMQAPHEPASQGSPPAQRRIAFDKVHASQADSAITKPKHELTRACLWSLSLDTSDRTPLHGLL